MNSDKVDRLARELAELTGESLTDAVVHSLERRLAEEHRRRRLGPIDDLVDRFGQLSVRDARSADDLLGYDENGLPR